MRYGVVIAVIILACTAECGIALAVEKVQRVKSGFSSSSASVPSVLSIIPAQAEPGRSVTVSGSGFGDKITVFMGTVEIGAKVTGTKKLEFVIPIQLEPGMYALNLKRGDGVTGRPYNFQILPLRPILSGLTPDSIGSCAQGLEREVIASGQNFSDKSMLLFDGAAIKSRLISPESMAFTVPQVTGGLHQVVIKNSPDISSVPFGLAIETTPEISQVSVGKEYVNYYELIISGRNFQQNSSIYVDGVRIGGKGQEFSQKEKLVYIDCSTLIYQRYPYSPVNKDLRIQVLSQAGEGSQVVNVTAP